MLSTVLTDTNGRAPAVNLLRPALLPDGNEPEERVVVCGMSWEQYLAFDKALGDDRPGPRLYFLDGEVEIVTTSNEHERVKKWIADLLADYFIHKGVEIMPRGQATMRVALKTAGAEPDESWCIGQESTFPDLVLEIALTSGGINKLKVYNRFKIPEVWIWQKNKLHIFTRNRSGHYDPVQTSRLLADLDVRLLQRCVAIPSWLKAKQTFRQGLESR